METCKSPRKVMVAAHELAKRFMPDYRSPSSRKDFTLPQLFACLVLREHQKKSYRGTEALLNDCPEWRADIGLSRTPDHNTLCRAFKHLVKPGRMNRMLDQMAVWAKHLKLIQGRVKPLALDSSMFESRHVSRHFEKRRQQTERQQREKAGKAAKIEANRRRRAVVKRLPKLSLAVAGASHLILAARATTGAGGDQPFFGPLLADACRRAKVKIAVADAGYDSEANHCLARQDLGVRSIIPAGTGRPTHKPPPTRYRRLMQQRFARKADQRYYGQRWQVETVNSMIKRNLGSALRARTARRRSMELLLRVITHDLMILIHAEE
jgi:transposase